MITAKLTWTIECEDCERKYTQTYETNHFSSWTCGHISEEELGGDSIIESARNDGWDFERKTYEELTPYCPNCRGKQ